MSETTQAIDATTQDDNDEDAAFAAGFSAITGDEPPASKPAAPEKSAADTFAEEAARDEAADAARASASEGSSTAGAVQALPTDEMAALKARLSDIDSVKQGLDKLAGTVGGINRALQELRQIQGNATATPEGAAAARAARKIERALLAELDTDYPDIVDKLLPGVERIMQATGTTPAADDRVAALEEQNRRLDEKIRRAEFRELSRQHPNWETEVALKDEHGRPVKDDQGRLKPSREFEQFFNSKPVEWRNQFLNAEEADFVSAAITEFKQSRATQPPAGSPAPAPAPTPTPTPAPAPSGLSKQQRLRQAMVPAGAPAATPAVTIESEDDALIAGFKAVRGGAS